MRAMVAPGANIMRMVFSLKWMTTSIVPAAMHMRLDPGAAGLVAELGVALFDRLGLVFEEQDDLARRCFVLPDDRRLQHGELSSSASNSRCSSAPIAFALIVDVDDLHGPNPLSVGSGVRPLCPSPSLHEVIGKTGGNRKGRRDFLRRREGPVRYRRTDEEVRAARTCDGDDLRSGGPRR